MSYVRTLSQPIPPESQATDVPGNFSSQASNRSNSQYKSLPPPNSQVQSKKPLTPKPNSQQKKSSNRAPQSSSKQEPAEKASNKRSRDIIEDDEMSEGDSEADRAKLVVERRAMGKKAKSTAEPGKHKKQTRLTKSVGGGVPVYDKLMADVCAQLVRTRYKCHELQI